MSQKKTLVGAGSLTMLVIAAGFVILTLHRYGGTDGAMRRVRAEFAIAPSHPLHVPTPDDLIAAPAGELEPRSPLSGLLSMDDSVPLSAAATPELNNAATSEAGHPVSTSQSANLSAGQASDRRAAAAEPVGETPAKARDVAASQVVATETPVPPTVPPALLPPAKQLDGLTHYWQTWNNCGPATLSMNLSYFGIRVGQDKIGAILRPEKDDKNVGPAELAGFAREQGLTALVRVNGDALRLKTLLSANIPVLVETWYEPKPNDGMGHYRLLVGYDDAMKTWIAYDSYDSHGVKKGEPYAGIRLPYDNFDKLWKVFGRTYIVLFDAARTGAVGTALGSDLDDAAMWEKALSDDRAGVKADPMDPFAWFNLGTDYVALGHYDMAAQAYDTARRLKLPWRMLWYQFGPFQAYFEVSRHQEVITLADATIGTAKTDEELFFWKGLAQKALGDLTGARASLQQAIKLRPSYKDAQDALRDLE